MNNSSPIRPRCRGYVALGTATAILLLMAPFRAGAQTTIASWSFESVTISGTDVTSPIISSTLADGGAQTTGSAVSALHTSAATDWSSPAGNGSTKSLSANTWAAGDYFQFRVNTTGYRDITLSLDQVGSGTGPRTFRVQYSLTGSSFTDFGPTYDLTSTPSWSSSIYRPAHTRTFDLSSVTALYDRTEVYFRITVATGSLAINGDPIAAGGTSRIDNFTVQGQPITPPINDDCIGPLALYPTTPANCPVAGTTFSTWGASPTPASCTAAAHDIWFDLVPFGGHTFVTLAGAGGAAVGVEVLAAPFNECEGVSVYCGWGGSHSIATPEGHSYMMRVFTDVPADLTLCVNGPVENDACTGATWLGGAQTYGSCSPTTGTTQGSTPGGGSCGTSDADVWFYFQATTGSASFVDLEAVTASGLGIEVLDDCGGNSVYCGTGLGHTVPTTSGQNYWVRVFSSTPGEFTICASAAQYNDDCDQATWLGGAQTYGSCSPTTGTTQGSTPGGGSCGTSDADVWFYFQATTGSASFVDLEAVTASDLGIEVFETDCNGSSVYCGDGNTHTVPTISGQYYFIRVYTDTPGEFTVCVSAVQPNDECDQAAYIGNHAVGDCPANATAGTTAGSTPSGGSCGATSNDVWYYFYSYSSLYAQVSLAEDGATGLGIEVFEDVCGGGNVYCAGGNSHAVPVIPDHYYWVRVHSATGGGFSICVSNVAQPANDECESHHSLNVYSEGDCPANATAGTTLGASSSGGSCNGTLNDVWYYFYNSNSLHTTISLTPGTASGMGVEVYSDSDGDCSLASIFCASGNNHLVPTSPGQYYRIRVYATTPGDFSVCLTSIQQPANDECASHHSLSVYSDHDCPANATMGTTLGASSSGGTCNGILDDVWYWFYGSNSLHTTISLTPGTASGMGVEVYSDSDGDCSLASIFCASGNSHLVPTSPGQYYRIRVYATTPGDFSICLTSIPQPANDECGNDAYLGVSGEGDCPANATPGTTIGASSSGGNCNGTLDDVWYWFYGSNSLHTTISLTLGTASGMGVEVYSDPNGDCSVSSIYCADGVSHTFPTTPDEVYRIRVYTTTPGDFSICLTRIPQPTNDECGNNVHLGVHGEGDCPANAIPGTTIGASSSGGSCNGTSNDVWYWFYGSNSVHTTINLTPGTAGGLGLEVYGDPNGDCSVSSIYCADGVSHTFPTTPDEVYRIRVYTTTPGDFSICLTRTPQPTNDECGYQANLSVHGEGDCPTYATTGTTIGASSSGGTCNGALNDVWYYFYGSNSVHTTINLTPGTAGGLGVEVYSDPNGDCSVSSIYCADGVSHTFPTTHNELYRIRVYTTTPGDFSICLTRIPQPGNDACTSSNGLSVYNVGTCPPTPHTGTTLGASPSGGGCGVESNDVWYHFQATAGGTTLVNLAGTSASGLGIEVFEVDCDGASVYCENGDIHTVPTTPGQYYRMRVYSATDGGFTVCVSGETDCTGAAGGTNIPGAPCAYPYAPSGIEGTWNISCQCEWVDCEGTAQGWASPGNACDDQDPLTINETWQNDCTCSGGTDCAGVIGGTNVPGAPCSYPYAPPGITGTWNASCQCDFTNCLGEENVWANYPGTPCDDGDPETINEVWQAGCTCGEGTDCTGVPGGPNVPGTPCLVSYAIDGTPFHGAYNANCQCEWTDCDEVVNGTAYPGQPCDDGVAATPNSYWNSSCVCADYYDCEGILNGPALVGTPCLVSTDPLGVPFHGTRDANCNCVYTDCESVANGGAYPGSSCDDGNASTYGDALDADCDCKGYDCNGVYGGTATMDNCGYCTGGNTGQEACVQDCHGDWGGTAQPDDCGVCAGGNTGVTPNSTCPDCAGVPNGPSVLDGCGTCRLPDDPAFIHTYQTIAFSGQPGFTSSYLNPVIGSPTTTYTVQVLYTNSANALPAYGYPRLRLDFEGNGTFNGPNDRTIVLTPLDINDLTTSDGKLYGATVTGLAPGTNWKASIEAFAGICILETGTYDYPDVLLAPDLEIFANDITFSEPNPGVSSALTVSAVVHNTSDHPVINPMVRLVNEFAPGTPYPDVMLPTIPPHGSEIAVWEIITPPEVAWCPMRVEVDPDNLIAESNELNNTAVRPFINGPYNLPGGIHIYAEADPQVSCFTPNSNHAITIHGHAYYYGTAVPLQDSSVAGATVTVYAPQGGVYSGYTNALGYFSIAIPAVNQMNVFTVNMEVTDYTLTGPGQTTYERVPCVSGPDLVAEVSLSDHQILAGESVSGQVTVTNHGNEGVAVNTLLDIHQNGGAPIVENVVVPPLAPGESFTTTFADILFDTPGLYQFCGTADAEDVVVELYENNTHCTYLTVLSPLPDIVPWSGPNGSVPFCQDPSGPVFDVLNAGYVPAVPFDVRVLVYKDAMLQTTFTEHIDGLAAGVHASFTLPYTYPAPGLYTFELECDIPLPNGVVAELNENNNSHTYTFNVVPCGVDILPIGGPSGQGFVCQAVPLVRIMNDGLLPTGPFSVSVAVTRDGDADGSWAFEIPDLGPMDGQDIIVPYSFPAAGTYAFEVACDTGGEVAEIDEGNNTTIYTVVLFDCKPDLTVSFPCGEQIVEPIDPAYPGTVTYHTWLHNRGNAEAVDPVVRFETGDPYTDVTYTGTLIPGDSIKVTTVMASVPPATEQLLVTADPGSLIDELAETNNTVSDNLCWEFYPTDLPNNCGWDFWDFGYQRDQPIPMYVGVWATHLYWASQVNVRFTVSGPGVPGTMLLGDALLTNTHDVTCYPEPCPYVASLLGSFVPPEGGTYTFTMTVDPDGVYTECDESNNTIVRQVIVADRPDLRVLSQHINPSKLNPDPDEPITFNVSYENIGISNLTDSFDLRVLVNEVELAVIENVPGLITCTSNTVSVPVPFSSSLVGIHVVRLIVDANNEVDESDELNNEATRAFIVGASANLYFASFTPSDGSPAVGQSITLDATIANNGDLPISAEVWYYRVQGTDTLFIGSAAVSVEANSSVPLSRSYTVEQAPSRILARIKNPSGLEFDDTDNDAVLHLNPFDVSLASTDACPGVSFGSLTASASGGTAPYTFLWTNGTYGELLEGVGGSYSVMVMDATGKVSFASGSIGNDGDCLAVPVRVAARLKLEGPYDAVTGLMNDALRMLPSFPNTDPYPSLGYAHTGFGNNGSVGLAALSAVGNNAIVDWVLLELRSTSDPATIVASRAALVQRDGDVVGTDGTLPVSFSVPPGDYHIAVRHRNHLGAMTADPVSLSVTPQGVDLTSPSMATYGAGARKSVGGTHPAQVLWAGDILPDGVVRYTGEDNDRDPILLKIGGVVPTNTVTGYLIEDVNLDGVVRYTGENNDRDLILQNIGGVVPTATRPAQLP